MKRALSMAMVSAGAILAVAGIARSVLAVDVTPSSVYVWTGADYGAGAGNVPGALNMPGDPGPTVWTWNPYQDSQPLIDNNGRIYFRGSFAATPQINSVYPGGNNGIFTATSPTNLALSQAWATGQLDPTTGLPLVSNDGSFSGIGNSATLRISGSRMALGVSVGNPPLGTGVNEFTSGTGPTATLQNNGLLYSGTYNAQTFSARTGDVIASLPSHNDWTTPATATGLGNAMASFPSVGTQFYDMNPAGTSLISSSLATVGPNPATDSTFSPAPGTTGNASFLGTLSAGGSYNVIARAGDLPFGTGGPQFNGSNNGVGGYFMKINQSGQVAYDATFLAGTPVDPAPGGVTPETANSAWIHTPGAGTRATQNSQFYQSGVNLPAHADPATGTTTSNGSALWTGGIGPSQSSFSNAGVLYTASTTGGDSFAAPYGTLANLDTTNTQVLMVSTAPGGLTPTYFQRQNDVAPGFSAPSNVHIGAINAQNLAINNSGTIAFMGNLQGAGVTPSVDPVYTTTFPPPFGFPVTGPPTISPGVFGNETALFTGTPGITGPTGLQAIARKGDVAPGFGSLTYDLNPSYASVWLNNAGDVLFQSFVADKVVGSAIDAYANPPAALNEFTALFGYSAALGTVTPMLYVGQQIEVSPGVFKYIGQFAVTQTDDGNGSTMGFNDHGRFVAWINYSDTASLTTLTGTAYVVLQIPAPGAGALALLGLGAMARRRRRA